MNTKLHVLSSVLALVFLLAVLLACADDNETTQLKSPTWHKRFHISCHGIPLHFCTDEADRKCRNGWDEFGRDHGRKDLMIECH